ncbi:hypothetical protein ES705_28801 [subsurface metagenome]
MENDLAGNGYDAKGGQGAGVFFGHGSGTFYASVDDDLGVDGVGEGIRIIAVDFEMGAGTGDPDFMGKYFVFVVTDQVGDLAVDAEEIFANRSAGSGC